MVHVCIVKGCTNRSNKKGCEDIKFYTLPWNNTKLLNTWLARVKRTRQSVGKHSRVCSVHFTGGTKSGKTDIPQHFPWQKPPRKAPKQRSFVPHQQPMSAYEKVAHDHTYTKEQVDISHTEQVVLSNSQCQLTPVLGADLLKSLGTMDAGIDVTVKSVTVSTNTQQPSTCDASVNVKGTGNFGIELFIEDDSAVHFYTGFDSYSSLMLCYKFLGTAVDHLCYWGSKTTSHGCDNRGAPRSLTPLNEFFLVLCRLRCGLMERDLGYHFCISQSTVSRILITWINFLYCKFKELNIWPPREQIDKFMPKTFRELYPTTRCVIDATEIFIQMPSNPAAQQLTYSSYKNHNTLKALIGITPSGAISFISKLFGGSISDRELTIKSGLLDLLEFGDCIMADRGFTIADVLDTRGVTLNIPSRNEHH